MYAISPNVIGPVSGAGPVLEFGIDVVEDAVACEGRRDAFRLQLCGEAGNIVIDRRGDAVFYAGKDGRIEVNGAAYGVHFLDADIDHCAVVVCH